MNIDGASSVRNESGLYGWALDYGCSPLPPDDHPGVTVWRELEADEKIRPGDVTYRGRTRHVYTSSGGPVGPKRGVFRRPWLPRTGPQDLTDFEKGRRAAVSAEAERGLAEIRRRRAARAEASCLTAQT